VKTTVLPSESAMRANIAHVYSLATADDIRRGNAWYPLAHGIVREWADTFGRSMANVACIIAALSPQNEWTRNLIQADDILHGNMPSIGGIAANIRKARAIRDDNATDTIDYFPTGFKVRAFACNLAGDYSLVTIDTHALQIAAGEVSANLRIRTWDNYATFAGVYTAVAKRFKLEPAILQAITWITWKRLYSPEHKRSVRRRW
jgi:hypothetical protein